MLRKFSSSCLENWLFSQMNLTLNMHDASFAFFKESTSLPFFLVASLNEILFQVWELTSFHEGPS